MTPPTTALIAHEAQTAHRVQATLGAQIRWDDAERCGLFSHTVPKFLNEDAPSG